MTDTLRLAGALVAPHSHDDLVVGVHESGAEVVPAVSVFDFGLGFDVTEGPAGEANVALDLAESVWTFGQGGFRLRDGSGPLLSTRASGNTLDVTGRLDVSSVAAIGSLANAEDSRGTRWALRVMHESGDCSILYAGAGIYVALVGNSTTQGYSYGITGEAHWTGTGAWSYVDGLCFNAVQDGADLTQMRGVAVNLLSYAGKGAIGSSVGFDVLSGFQGYKPATFRGLWVHGHVSMNTVYGVHVEDFTGTTVRLLEVGPATPYLRLVGGAAPGGNLTNLYLAEGATPSLRRVQWKDGAGIGAGDRVMVLV